MFMVSPVILMILYRGVPSFPSDPGVPSVPRDPGVPSVPRDPGVPSDPGVHGVSSDPDNPVLYLVFPVFLVILVFQVILVFLVFLVIQVFSVILVFLVNLAFGDPGVTSVPGDPGMYSVPACAPSDPGVHGDPDVSNVPDVPSVLAILVISGDPSVSSRRRRQVFCFEGASVGSRICSVCAEIDAPRELSRGLGACPPAPPQENF